jgi:hypothetical protein
LISLIKKKISDYPNHWHKVLSEALWAHRISKHRATKVSPFELIYGQEVVLPVEISLNVVMFARQNDLAIGDYYNLMTDNIDEVTDKRLVALGEIEKDKIMVAEAYNKKVKAKSFPGRRPGVEDHLTTKEQRPKFEKWSPSWEGPYRITQVITGNAYVLQTLQGEDLPKVLNDRFLKQYHPSVGQDA